MKKDTKVLIGFLLTVAALGLIGTGFKYYYSNIESDLLKDLVGKFYEVNEQIAYPNPVGITRIRDNPLTYAFYTAVENPTLLKAYSCEKQDIVRYGDTWICSRWNEVLNDK